MDGGNFIVVVLVVYFMLIGVVGGRIMWGLVDGVWWLIGVLFVSMNYLYVGEGFWN